MNKPIYSANKGRITSLVLVLIVLFLTTSCSSFGKFNVKTAEETSAKTIIKKEQAGEGYGEIISPELQLNKNTRALFSLAYQAITDNQGKGILSRNIASNFSRSNWETVQCDSCQKIKSEINDNFNVALFLTVHWVGNVLYLSDDEESKLKQAYKDKSRFSYQSATRAYVMPILNNINIPYNTKFVKYTLNKRARGAFYRSQKGIQVNVGAVRFLSRRSGDSSDVPVSVYIQIESVRVGIPLATLIENEQSGLSFKMSGQFASFKKNVEIPSYYISGYLKKLRDFGFKL